MVFFESPHRTEATLRAMAEIWGPGRSAAVCRELTKTYEEVKRGGVLELADWAADQEHGVRGEVTIVVAGDTDEQRAYSAQELSGLVAEQEAAGSTRRDAIAMVVDLTGARKKDVYAAAHGSRA